jgi:hypothetical protein
MNVSEAVIDLFLENAANSATVTHRAEGPEELHAALSGIIPQDADVFCPSATELEKIAAAGCARLDIIVV